MYNKDEGQVDQRLTKKKSLSLSRLTNKWELFGLYLLYVIPE